MCSLEQQVSHSVEVTLEAHIRGDQSGASATTCTMLLGMPGFSELVMAALMSQCVVATLPDDSLMPTMPVSLQKQNTSDVPTRCLHLSFLCCRSIHS